MNIQFVGPALKAEDDGVLYLAHVDGKEVNCHFTYEAIEDIESDSLQTDLIQQFKAHQLKLLSIAEDKIRKGHITNGVVSIFTNDINF
jgi:peroxiredoxin family protein